MVFTKQYPQATSQSQQFLEQLIVHVGECPPDLLNHAVQTARLLDAVGMDSAGIAAGFYYSLGEADAIAGMDNLPGADHAETFALYRKSNRLRMLTTISRSEERPASKGDEERLRKMLIAMVDDARVALIGLAHHLAELRLCKNQPAAVRRNLAVRAKDIYAPLANRLGIRFFKWELEDLAFRYLNPEAYTNLAAALHETRFCRERFVSDFVNTVEGLLAQSGITAEVTGRPKHLYSIWKKMQTKGLAFGQLWDLHAIRVMTHSVEHCYASLSLIHEKWRSVPAQFSDYIVTPKANGYQSIHSIVLGPEQKAVEVQIRTFSMHEESEQGVAAHWRYKEAGVSGLDDTEDISRKIQWLRQVLAWQSDVLSADAPDSRPKAHSSAASPDTQTVFVFTPRGNVVALPRGATPIDFAYAIHSDVGHRTRGAQVNGRMVSLNSPLQTGDQVFIQTTKQGGPSRDWLRNDLHYTQSPRAKNRIAHWFKQQSHDQHTAEGRTQLERAMHRQGLEDLSFEKINDHTHFSRIDDLFTAIGAGDYKVSRALAPFRSQGKLPYRAARKSSSARQLPKAVRADGMLNVRGIGNLLTRIANCCSPSPGDAIGGYITAGKGISVHRADCGNFQHLRERCGDRIIEVTWSDTAEFSQVKKSAPEGRF